MNKGTLRVVKGDVRSPQFTMPNEFAIIPHCCNNLGVMGAGVALALRNKWPRVFEIYQDMAGSCNVYRLGETSWDVMDDNIIVANMIAQNGTVSDLNPKPVKYLSLIECMKSVANIAKYQTNRSEFETAKFVIHTCKFGSELAGGNWEFILELINEIWLAVGIDVVVYEFE